MKRARSTSPVHWHLPSVSLLALLALTGSSEALSSHSPQDLFAYPKFQVVLSEHGVLNDTVPTLLRDHRQLASESVDPIPALHLLRTPAGQAFLCTVPVAEDPPVSSAPEKEEELAAAQARRRQAGFERGVELVEGMRGSCLYQKQGWFTYSFCYGDQIRQFHEVRTAQGPSEDPATEAYTLGQAPAPEAPPAVPKYGSGSGLVTQGEQKARVPSTLGGGQDSALGWDDGGRYLSQKWEGGTLCDKTGLPRTVEVQYHCSTQSTDRIALIRETSICAYVMLIHTPRLCGEAIFLEGNPRVQEPASIIQCQPVLKTLRDLVDAPVPEAPSPDPATPETSTQQVDEEIGLDEVFVIEYDPETGVLQSTDSQVKLVDLTTTPGQVAGQTADSTSEPAPGAEAAQIDELSDLARIMKQSMEDVLRQIARERPVGAAEAAPPPANDDNRAVAPNGVVIEGLEGLLAAVQRGAKDASSGSKDKKETTMLQLDEYLSTLETALQEKGVMAKLKEGLRTGKTRRFQGGLKTFESEEHAKLAKVWGKSFDDDGVEEVQDKSQEEKEEEALPAHDEL